MGSTPGRLRRALKVAVFFVGMGVCVVCRYVGILGGGERGENHFLKCFWRLTYRQEQDTHTRSNAGSFARHYINVYTHTKYSKYLQE
jgi:hypothetical protein